MDDSPPAENEKPDHEKTLEELIAEEEEERKAKARQAAGGKFDDYHPGFLGRFLIIFIWLLTLMTIIGGYVYSLSLKGELKIDWYRYSARQWAAAIVFSVALGLALQTIHASVGAYVRRRRSANTHR